MRHSGWFVLTLLAATTAAGADIYCNTQGRDCSDRPTTTATVQRSVAGAGSRTGSAAPAAATGSAATSGDRVAQQREDAARLAQARKELSQDVGSKRGQQCKEASDYYQRLITASVVTKSDKDGKRLALSDAEAGQARLNAKLQMDQLCAQAGAR
jgi:hypothetical protein